MQDLEKIAEINKIKEKESEVYLDAIGKYYKKKTMLYRVLKFNQQFNIIENEEDLENFVKFVETVKYSASVPYGFYGILDVYDLDGEIFCDHDNQLRLFERLKCPAQRTRMMIDYARTFKNEKQIKSRPNIDNFYEVIRMRLKQLTKRHFQRVIVSTESFVKNNMGTRELINEEKNKVKYHKQIVNEDKIMHQYRQSITFLDKKYSFEVDEEDEGCMKGIYIPLIIDNRGRSDIVPLNKTINIIKHGERNDFFTDRLLKELLYKADMPEKRIAKLRTLFNYIDECFAINKSSLWHLYLIGYILKLNVAIIDFSCFGYVDQTKLQTRAKTSGIQRFHMDNDGAKDNNLFSPADERQILRRFFSGGGKKRRRRRRNETRMKRKTKIKQRKTKNRVCKKVIQTGG